MIIFHGKLIYNNISLSLTLFPDVFNIISLSLTFFSYIIDIVKLNIIFTYEACYSSCRWTGWTWDILCSSMSCAFYHRSRCQITNRSLFLIVIGWIEVHQWYHTGMVSIVTVDLQNEVVSSIALFTLFNNTYIPVFNLWLFTWLLSFHRKIPEIESFK